jgi:hypothetical protein
VVKPREDLRDFDFLRLSAVHSSKEGEHPRVSSRFNGGVPYILSFVFSPISNLQYNQIINSLLKMKSKSKYWFKRKRYGYGWTPSSKEGWLLILVYLAVVILGVFFFSDKLESGDMFYSIAYSVFVIISTTLLLLLTVRKAPKGKWRWGWKEGDDEDQDY